jgi:hypothetical protein
MGHQATNVFGINCICYSLEQKVVFPLNSISNYANHIKLFCNKRNNLNENDMDGHKNQFKSGYGYACKGLQRQFEFLQSARYPLRNHQVHNM